MKIDREVFKAANIDPESITDDEQSWLDELMATNQDGYVIGREQVVAVALFFRRKARIPKANAITKAELYDALQNIAKIIHKLE